MRYKNFTKTSVQVIRIIIIIIIIINIILNIIIK